MLRRRSFVWVGFLSTVLTAQLLLANDASAYTREGHLEITNGAWQIMRAFSATNTTGTVTLLRQPTGCTSSSSPCGAAVTQAQWNDFRAKVDWARRLLGVQPHSVPVDTKDGAPCFADPAGLDLADFPASLTDAHHEHNKNSCGVDPRGPKDFYNELEVPGDGKRNQGYVLGWHAKNRDDDLKETTVEVPILAGTLIPVALEAGAAGWNKVAAAVFTPIACVWTFLSGRGDCRDVAKKWAEKTNLPGIINAGIPGINVPNMELTIGFWHLMDVQSEGWYNDHPGMDLFNGGPGDVPSAVDLALAAGFTFLSTRIDPANSSGDNRYQMNGSDGHEGSLIRSNLDWRKYNVGITEFSPLDNLAWYGYSAFPTDQIKRLGWPLHAIGDATVPMHVAATTGYGHDSYEQWVEDHVHDLLLSGFCSTGCSKAWRTEQQQKQAYRVLMQAYRWHSYLQTHGIRDFITALGEQTLSKAGASPSGWPWCDLCSAAMYLQDAGILQAISTPANWVETETSISLLPSGTLTPDNIVKNPLGYYESQITNIRSLVEDAMGAKIAFMTWAASKIPSANQCIPTKHLGCRNSDDCCDSNMICHSKNETVEMSPGVPWAGRCGPIIIL